MNAPVHALYVPAISSRHGSLVSERLANEGEPEVDVLLAEDLDRLVELLVHEGRGRGHGR